LARATAQITLANLADNMRHLVWIDGRTAPASRIQAPKTLLPPCGVG
jgi:hypothetical protein